MMLRLQLPIDILLISIATVGCRSPAEFRRAADDAAAQIIKQTQSKVYGRTRHFTIAPPEDQLRCRLLIEQNLPQAGIASMGTRNLTKPPHWPAYDYLENDDRVSDQRHLNIGTGTIRISLKDALHLGARNSREYQARKEDVFRAALNLDLKRNEFRSIFSGEVTGLIDTNASSGKTVTGIESNPSLKWARQLKGGATLTSQIALDLVSLLSGDHVSTFGFLADATISIPLLRGSGMHIATEPLTQAEREVLYAMRDFERFKRTFAVRIASNYLAVLRQLDEAENSEDNYRNLIASARRARRLADAGRLPEIQVDQAMQNELRTRDRWIDSRQTYARRVDEFRILLGLPTDARIELDREELPRLAAASSYLIDRATKNEPQEDDAVPPADAPIHPRMPSQDNAGPLELDESVAVREALNHRADLQITIARVEDAQRQVIVAADALRPELTLLGTSAIGEARSIATADSVDAQLRFERGHYSGLLTLDLPLERTAERNAYRDSLIVLEESVRDVQALEDQIKIDVRNGLRSLLQSRESLQIQTQAVTVAERRVKSTDLLLQAGRAQIRDVLEAQEALISAQNALTSALVTYRISELELQRDMGTLEIDDRGLFPGAGQ